MNINKYGYVRVASCAPNVRVADCDFNVEQIKLCIDSAIEQKVQVLIFPELSITSASCGDLFFQDSLQHAAIRSLDSLVDYMKNRSTLVIAVGLPLRIDAQLYNVAAIINHQGIAGFVPKTNLEGDDKRWFASIDKLPTSVVVVNNKPVAIDRLILRTPQANIAFEIGSDILLPEAPAISLALNGADIICNLSAVASQKGISSKIKSLIKNKSQQIVSGYIFSSAGVGESTTDAVYLGKCFIADNGEIVSSNGGFSLDNEIIYSEIDILALRNERLKKGYFKPDNVAPQNLMDIINIDCELSDTDNNVISRTINPKPFVPSGELGNEEFQEIFNIQVYSLVKRLQHTNVVKTTIGVSGGLDSTLALLVMVKAYDVLGIPRENIIGITMPGFGTTGRTYQNSIDLMRSLGVTAKEISIKDAVVQHFKDIEHDIDQHDLTYENSQARERTQILMDYAGKIGGFVVGTGNMSELTLGWATYNGDHMSMYAINAGLPKTLVQAMTVWLADNEYYGLTQKVLRDIVDTPYSPELLPADDKGEIAQETENFIGPYELHDFFMFRMLQYGDSPLRILFIAQHAFKGKYEEEEIKHWLKVFIKRFFSQQFKRSCMPDAPRVVSVSLSPRGGYAMPSDAVAKIWLNELGD